MGEATMDRNLVQWLGRHCVALLWEDAEAGREGATGGVVCSSFVMSVHDRWLLVTAGHMVDAILARQAAGRSFRFAKLADSWAQGNIDKNAVTFPDITD